MEAAFSWSCLKMTNLMGQVSTTTPDTVHQRSVNQSYEMYCSVEYSEEYSAPGVTLYELSEPPLKAILKKVKKVSTLQKIVLITDTYTTLLPCNCLSTRS